MLVFTTHVGLFLIYQLLLRSKNITFWQIFFSIFILQKLLIDFYRLEKSNYSEARGENSLECWTLPWSIDLLFFHFMFCFDSTTKSMSCKFFGDKAVQIRFGCLAISHISQFYSIPLHVETHTIYDVDLLHPVRNRIQQRLEVTLYLTWNHADKKFIFLLKKCLYSRYP